MYIDSNFSGVETFTVTNFVIADVSRAQEAGNEVDLMGTFVPDVLSYSDYYPFGMIMPKRSGSVDGYRYGFQGQEMDDEIKGEGNSLNYRFRMYDPRVGRFFGMDPLAPQYPWYSPYQFAGNKVILFIELEGLEEEIAPLMKKWSYKPVFKKDDDLNTLERVDNALTNVFSISLHNAWTNWDNLVNGTVNETYWMITGQKNYDLHNDVVGPLGESLDDIYKYHRDTPIKQQLSDAGESLTRPENLELVWEMAIPLKYKSSTKFDVPNQGILSRTTDVNIGQIQDFTKIGSTGTVGETFLKKLGGTSQKMFDTTRGRRFVDQLVNGVAYESKVGYTSLTDFVKTQIAKDTELLSTGQVNKVIWTFFESPVTGKAGASKPLLKALEDAGIETQLIRNGG